MTHTIVPLFVLLLISNLAFAHFPWLTADHVGNVQFCFGENLAEKQYKLPDPITNAEVMCLGKDGKVSKVGLKKIESDEFIGLVSEEPVEGTMLMAKLSYGMYAGSKLDYYAMHLAGPLPKDRASHAKEKVDKSGAETIEAAMASRLELHAELVETDQGVDVFVMWKGVPIADLPVKLYSEAGHETGAAKTDKDGKVSFSDKEVEGGLNGIMVGHKLENDKGELGGKAYTSSSHYLTVTFHGPQDFE